MEGNTNSFEEEKIDIKDFLLKMLGYWHFFIISLIVSILIAYAINRTSVPVYEVHTSLLIQEEQSMLDSRFASDLGIYKNQNQLSNEIGILKSYNLTQRAIKQLDFEVEYYSSDGFVDHEIYKDCPFKVVLDSTSLQPLFTKLEIKIISPNEFILKTKNKNVTLFDVKDLKKTDYRKIYTFTQPGKLFFPIKIQFCHILLGRLSI